MLNRSIRYAINFLTAVKTSSARFNELLIFSGSSLQATYGHLLVQASYSQTNQYSKQRSGQAQRLPTVSSELRYCICLVQGSKAFTVLVFRALGFSSTDCGMILHLQLLDYFAISEGKRLDTSWALILNTYRVYNQSTVVAKRSSSHKQYYPLQLKHPSRIAAA